LFALLVKLPLVSGLAAHAMHLPESFQSRDQTTLHGVEVVVSAHATSSDAGMNSSEVPRKRLTAEEMHLLLDSARLSAMSHGESILTPHRWNATLTLNAARVARLQAKRGGGGNASSVLETPSR